MPSNTKQGTDSPEPEITDKSGAPIHVGDLVSTKIRGGKRAGEVSDIAYTQADARALGVKNPPKVLFEDQHGHSVAHNPGTLVHGENPK